MVEGPTVSGYIVGHMVRVLRELGQNPDPVLARTGLAESALAEADARIPVDVTWECFELADALCAEPQLGLQIASRVGEGYPMLRFSLRNAATLGDALDRYGRFYGLISDHGTQSLARGNTAASMRCDRLVEARMPVVLEDWMVGQWLRLGRSLVGVDWTPLAVQLEHSSQGRSAAYEEWFGAPVRFDGDRSEMHIPNSALELPIRGSDASLSAVLDRHIEEVLANRADRASFTVRARAAMAKRLEGGDPGAAAIAKSLNVSERTLHRRLRDEGTTATDVLRQLRLELADKYLRDADISLTEIAYLLGYSEVSAFHRAFKRWTGLTPADFREQL